MWLNWSGKCLGSQTSHRQTRGRLNTKAESEVSIYLVLEVRGSLKVTCRFVENAPGLWKTGLRLCSVRCTFDGPAWGLVLSSRWSLQTNPLWLLCAHFCLPPSTSCKHCIHFAEGKSSVEFAQLLWRPTNQCEALAHLPAYGGQAC